ncbi:MAG: xylulokinase [Deltaproteobacteria bacterium]|nr:xylulokinase [Deltaproteobacteria bacterium]
MSSSGRELSGALLVGIDIGTSGAKVVLVDETGDVVTESVREYPSYSPQPLWSEQNPDDWARAAFGAVRAAIERSGTWPGRIAGIGLAGQMHGLVLCDAHGELLRPAILWNDQRTGPQCDAVTARLGLDTLIARTGNAMLPGFTAPKMLWVRDHEPDLWRRAASFALPKDDVRDRLTGMRASDVSDASGTALFDVTKRAWSDEMFADLGLDPALAPDCAESCEVIGAVTSEAARMTGLLAGTPVVAGAGDQAAQAIGAGLAHEGDVCVTIGTSGVVFAPTAAPRIEPQGRLHAFCHAVPGMWHVMGVMLSAGGSLRWYRDALCAEYAAKSRAAGRDPYDDLVGEAAQVPPGAEGLIFLPYLTGERTPHPDPLARGAFVGLTARHTRAHMTRAVIEGVGFGLLDALELVRASGVETACVRVSGGGVRSPLWRQILATQFGVPVVSLAAQHGASFGAALLAGVGAGVFADVGAACHAAVRIAETTEPIASWSARYRDLHAAYRSLYDALRPSFMALAER